ncbi:hypothetical protein ABVF61_00455 [Roseibium sp. HPY-6]|uniref:hypothetical protein n=1 Tax=Roseibium sp. HPY-6 TaxID=3229852 RepID=UPI00339045BE
MNSDTALTALAAVLTTLAAAETSIPSVHRNEPLEKMLEALDGDAAGYANLIDGDIQVDNVLIGNGAVYELTLLPTLEIIVQGDTDADRRAALSGIVGAVATAIDADPALGGACDDTRMSGIQRSGLVTEGVPNLAGLLILIEVQLTSDQPF